MATAPRRSCVVVGVCVLTQLMSCERRSEGESVAGVVVHAELATLRTEAVGDQLATFVLVDVTNNGPAGQITLAGNWLDAHGANVGPLAVQSRYVPKSATRTFVLVDEKAVARADVVSANVTVGSLVTTSPAPPGLVSNQQTKSIREQVADGASAILSVAADVTNQAARSGCLLVGVAFHSASGRPVAWRHSWLPIAAGATRGVQFFGPPGGITAAVTVDEWAEPRPEPGYCFGATQ